jgi:hypothetical protein
MSTRCGLTSEQLCAVNCKPCVRDASPLVERVPGTHHVHAVDSFRVALGIIDFSPHTSKVLRRRPKDMPGDRRGAAWLSLRQLPIR